MLTKLNGDKTFRIGSEQTLQSRVLPIAYKKKLLVRRQLHLLPLAIQPVNNVECMSASIFSVAFALFPVPFKEHKLFFTSSVGQHCVCVDHFG